MPVVVALPPDAEPLETLPDVEAVTTGLEKDVTDPVFPGVELVVLPLGTTVPLLALVEISHESVGNGRLGRGTGICEVGTLIVGRDTTPEMDDVRFQPRFPL